jgi:SAM-dependent methyltransferase
MPDSLPICPVCGASDARFLIRDRYEPRNRYLRCRACGSGFSAMRVSDIGEAADLHTSEYYTPGRGEPREVPAAEAHFLARLLSFGDSGRLLDVGCGRGRWLAYIREHSKFEVEGIEPSEAAAEYARSARGLAARTGDIVSAGYPDGAFDVVYLRNVLEHVAEPGELLGEIRRIMKPGGICAVHVPNDSSVTNILKRVLYRAGLTKEFGALFFPLHVTGFTPDSLVSLFRDSGFSTAGMETIAKVSRFYEFPFEPRDILLFPAAVTEHFTGRGNLIVGWFAKR